MSYKRKHQMWTGAEIARLKRFWPVMHKEGLLQEFAGRSWGSIKEMAARNGFKRPKNLGGHRDWKKIASEHKPTFMLPIIDPPQPKRPWS